MNKKTVAKQYLRYLENGEIDPIIGLFETDAIVESPIYGIKKAHQFYNDLKNDTFSSKLQLKGIFENSESNEIIVYFTYMWTLSSNEKVEFDVVDVIEFNKENKITKLKIIYDTVNARALVNSLKYYKK